jgi:cyclase
MAFTRRDFLAASAAAFTCSLVRPGFGHALPWSAEFTALRRNVGYFTLRGGTVGYLLDPAATVVVDSMFPAEARALIEGLRERTGGRAVDALINTHYHGDHTGGNAEFRGIARRVIAHEQTAAHLRQPPGAAAPPANAAEQLHPDTTFTDSWSMDAGGERVSARFYGRAHTSGDAVITFERANVAHMGDLMFNRRHPVVDGAAGATLRGWMDVLERAIADHTSDTIYIFGHAGSGHSVVGSDADITHFRSYIGAVLDFVSAQVRAGRSRDEILAMREPLAGFEEFGRFGQASARDPLTVAYEELTQ